MFSLYLIILPGIPVHLTSHLLSISSRALENAHGKTRIYVFYFTLDFLPLPNNYLNARNQTNQSEISKLLAICFQANATLPYNLRMAAEHDFSTKTTICTNTDTAFVTITGGKIMETSHQTSHLLHLINQLSAISDSSKTSSDQHSTPKNASLLQKRSWT